MANKSAADIKSLLAQRLDVLKQEHANPLQKHPLFPILDDLKLMRGKLGLSIEAIVKELKDLGLDTSPSELKRFFKLALATKPKKAAAGAGATPGKARS